jgi:hypothetical protein
LEASNKTEVNSEKVSVLFEISDDVSFCSVHEKKIHEGLDAHDNDMMIWDNIRKRLSQSFKRIFELSRRNIGQARDVKSDVKNDCQVEGLPNGKSNGTNLEEKHERSEERIGLIS